MKTKTYEDIILEETDVNGRMNFQRSAANPIALHRVTYNNAITNKRQSQSYLEMEDLIVPVIIKKDKETGAIFFAMQYESIPASDYYAQLELPDCPFFKIKKDQYSDEDVINCIDDNMNNLGLEMLGYKYLDSGNTAINQSITDQLMKIVCVYVEEKEQNKNLIWYPISCLPDFLDEKKKYHRKKEPTTLSTKYALRLFYKAFKKTIMEDKPTKFYYNQQIINKMSPWRDDKTIMEHKYRFGEKLVSKEIEDKRIVNHGNNFEVGTSKNSIECLLVKRVKGKKMIGLSRQQRSPFINREGIDEFFYEEVGGMVEDNENYEAALRREVAEETGIELGKGKLTQLTGLIMLGKGTEEASVFYLYEMNGTETNIKQTLDDEESIDEIQWFDLEEIDLNTFHAPLPTKYAILLARDYYEREKNEKQARKDNTR